MNDPYCVLILLIECAIKDTKGIIRSRKWKKNCQYNGHWMCNKRL